MCLLGRFDNFGARRRYLGHTGYVITSHNILRDVTIYKHPDTGCWRRSAQVALEYYSLLFNTGVGYRNWPRYGLRWSGLCCHSRHSTSGAGRRAAAPAGPTSAVPGVAAQTTTAQTVWVVNFYSTTICKLVDLIPALHQSDGRIPN